jgi:uncharacterized protein (TIGR03437 family)
VLIPNFGRITLYVLLAAGLAPAQSGGLFVDTASLAFAYVMGGPAPAPQTIGITSNGFQTFTVSNSFNSPWLIVTPESGAAPATLKIAVDVAGLAAGVYDGQLEISGALVKVRLTVYDAPKLIALPAILSFVYQTGQLLPGPQLVYVTASGKPVQVTAAAVLFDGQWLDVKPASAGTPMNFEVSVHPESLAPGSYLAALIVMSPEAPSQTVMVSLTVAPPIVTGPIPAFQSSGVTNLATWLPGAVAPGEMISIQGANFGGTMNFIGQPDASGRLPTLLGDTQVFFDNTPAALLLVGPTTLTVFVPYEIAGRNTTQVTVVHQGAVSNPVALPVAPSSPGIFTFGPAGQGQAIALDHDLTINSSSNPAAPGSIIVLYVTGEGQTAPPGVDGLIARSTLPLPTPVLPVSVIIDGKQAAVLYAGGVPTLAAGVIQVNAIIPADVATGNIPITVTIGPNTSREGVTIAIR